jgi:Spy/CpxP family protein refolding chaperone
MRSVSMLVFGCVAALGAASCGTAQEKAAPPQAQGQQPQGQQAPQGGPDWRERMQKNHNAERSIEQQVSRLTKDLDLTPDQQAKVRQLAKEHNDSIQQILDTAPDTLTFQGFQRQVHAISQNFHDSVNAILTPHQLALMKAMVGRLDSGTEQRRAP